MHCAKNTWYGFEETLEVTCKQRNVSCTTKCALSQALYSRTVSLDKVINIKIINLATRLVPRTSIIHLTCPCEQLAFLTHGVVDNNLDSSKDPLASASIFVSSFQYAISDWVPLISSLHYSVQTRELYRVEYWSVQTSSHTCIMHENRNVTLVLISVKTETLLCYLSCLPFKSGVHIARLGSTVKSDFTKWAFSRCWLYPTLLNLYKDDEKLQNSAEFITIRKDTVSNACLDC